MAPGSKVNRRKRALSDERTDTPAAGVDVSDTKNNTNNNHYNILASKTNKSTSISRGSSAGSSAYSTADNTQGYPMRRTKETGTHNSGGRPKAGPPGSLMQAAEVDEQLENPLPQQQQQQQQQRRARKPRSKTPSPSGSPNTQRRDTSSSHRAHSGRGRGPHIVHEDQTGRLGFKHHANGANTTTTSKTTNSTRASDGYGYTGEPGTEVYGVGAQRRGSWLSQGEGGVHHYYQYANQHHLNQRHHHNINQHQGYYDHNPQYGHYGYAGRQGSHEYGDMGQSSYGYNAKQRFPPRPGRYPSYESGAGGGDEVSASVSVPASARTNANAKGKAVAYVQREVERPDDISSGGSDALLDDYLRRFTSQLRNISLMQQSLFDLEQTYQSVRKELQHGADVHARNIAALHEYIHTLHGLMDDQGLDYPEIPTVRNHDSGGDDSSNDHSWLVRSSASSLFNTSPARNTKSPQATNTNTTNTNTTGKNLEVPKVSGDGKGGKPAVSKDIRESKRRMRALAAIDKMKGSPSSKDSNTTPTNSTNSTNSTSKTTTSTNMRSDSRSNDIYKDETDQEGKEGDIDKNNNSNNNDSKNNNEVSVDDDNSGEGRKVDGASIDTGYFAKASVRGSDTQYSPVTPSSTNTQ